MFFQPYADFSDYKSALLHETADLSFILSIYQSRDMKDMKDDQLLLVHGTADENVQLLSLIHI